jgi:hypothetical protein
VDSGAPPNDSSDSDPLPPEPIHSHLAKGAVPLPPPRPFDLSLSRSSTVVAAASSSRSSMRVSSAHVVVPPHRPELHASAERALYYSGPVRLPPKKPTNGAFDHVKSAKTARADY